MTAARIFFFTWFTAWIRCIVSNPAICMLTSAGCTRRPSSRRMSSVPSNVKLAQTTFAAYLLVVGFLIEFFPAFVYALILCVPGCADVPTPEGDMFAGITAFFYQYERALHNFIRICGLLFIHV